MPRQANGFEGSRNTLATLSVGGVFTDYRGQRVERLSETAVAIGAGLNNVLSVEEYLDLIYYGQRFGNYVILDTD